jgi:zeta toxin
MATKQVHPDSGGMPFVLCGCSRNSGDMGRTITPRGLGHSALHAPPSRDLAPSLRPQRHTHLHKVGCMNDYSIRFDPSAEIDRYFGDSSLATSDPPRAVIIAGDVAAGKTSLRCAKYSTGYVVLDAAEIFLSLCQGKSLDFPGPLEEPMIMIGHGVVQRIYRERRDFVTEIIGSEIALVTQLLEVIKGAGYRIEFAAITCDVSAAVERNANREANNISSYYTEHYHRQWILGAMAPDPKAQT